MAVASVVLAGGALGADGPACVVAYDDDRLTVQVERAPLEDVIHEIGRQTGAEIVGSVRNPRQVSQQFERLPLADAVGRLLGDQNFTLRYGPDGELRAVALLGGPMPVGEGSMMSLSQRAEPTDLVQPARNETRRPALAGEKALDAKLVAAAGTEVNVRRDGDSHAASGDLGTQAQGSQQDPNEQIQWPAPDETDRKLRRSFLNLLAQMDGPALAEYFTTKDGKKAQALLLDFAANHPSGSSSDKANEILGRSLEGVPATEPDGPPAMEPNGP